MKSKATIIHSIIICLLVMLSASSKADTIFSGTGPDYIQSTMGSQITLSLFSTNGAALFCYTNNQNISFAFMGTTKNYTNVLPAIGVFPQTNYIMTNLPVATTLNIDVVYTNLAAGWISNITTGASYQFGGSGAGGGTNQDSITIRLGPNEKWLIFTNTPSGESINYDEIRN